MRSRSETRWSCSDIAPGSSVRERHGRLRAEGLEQVGLVGLHRLAPARHHHADHAEGLTGGMEWHEQPRGHARAGKLAGYTKIGFEVGDAFRSRCAGHRRNDGVVGRSSAE